MADGQIGSVGDDGPKRVRYVDMTLGAWRPREAALQLAAGFEDGKAGNHLAAIAITGALIDLEADADPVIVAAHDDAATIARKLGPGVIIAVLAPRFGLPLRAENEWLFLFLRRLGLSVAIVGEPPGFSAVTSAPFERRRGVVAPEWDGAWPSSISAEAQRLLRFFPGLMPRALAEKHHLADGAFPLIPVGFSHFLIPADCRGRSPREAPGDFDLMAEVEAADQGFAAFSQCHCNNHFADATRLATLAQQALLAGGLDLAGALLERARAVARNPAETGLVDLIGQEARVFERRFAEAAKAPDPSRRAPSSIAARFRRLRGFAAASVGNVLTAERDLSSPLARLDGGERLSTDDSYILDALARARLASGAVENAANLALAIEAGLARDPGADPRIAFVNALTLAAIHRSRGNAEEEHATLTRAFAAGAGARHLAEIVEMNVAEARAVRDPQAAGLAWLRAAFAWLAIEPSEAFGARAASAILGRARPSRAQVDTEISEALTEALRRAALETVTPTRTRLPAIRVADRDPPVVPEKVFAAPGVAFLWSPVTIVTPVYAPARSRLVHVALGAFGELCPAARAIETGTILVDVNLGMDLPRDRDEAMTVAIRAGVKEIVFGSEVLPLAEGDRRRRIADLRIGLAPSVAAIEAIEGRVTVRFRRNLPDRRLAKEEAVLIAPLAGGAQISLGALAVTLGRPSEVLEPAFRRLEAERIVRMEATARAPSLHEDRHPV